MIYLHLFACFVSIIGLALGLAEELRLRRLWRTLNRKGGQDVETN